jgi:hypothetical protein
VEEKLCAERKDVNVQQNRKRTKEWSFANLNDMGPTWE